MRWKAKIYPGKPNSRYEWLDSYAWLPCKTIDNIWVWLEPIQYTSYYNQNILYGTPYSVLLNRCYRIPTKEN